MNENIYILGIETSCDDTSAAVLKGRKVLTNIVSSQKIHANWGGVVPELASRAHHQSIVPVVDLALRQAGIDKYQLSAIAYTRGPGLMGSLLVGATFARAMGLGLGIPVIPVHHMEAHILAHFIDDPDMHSPEFPFLCLTVSGGHTQLVLVNGFLDMKVIGQTTDDAAGEAFDKIAKILGLPYPGGPLIDKLAQHGNPHAFRFARPEVPGFDYSFSGLKTSVLYTLEKFQKEDPDFIKKHLNDISASVQQAIVDTLLKKVKLALDETKCKHLAVAGGVSANSGLRKALSSLAESMGVSLYVPKPSYCTDNGAMIAIAGYYYYTSDTMRTSFLNPVARWQVGS
ncbi:tRNA N6-adenosine threonylcarbamoyltransferase [Thermaurantimonas aggregans]|uniref:tRNA N6-adenosine threonylcarbamoyltransferase n=1 Tax=Thermaurantimonas aggregans TaxID=2173829 RepID=A0A401XNY2_9FLAO|nr:tRNA (adenosine(37)-N6)-threonylcarbamoyltransferase complex transferase subunit TsaD [Thermaurantimonas aggregans]MCX8149558.1 tRNA (adenosine(37)-N6)-threonylcarbamoyltransferase complex transferase subunit TsaD [Thermaurantimonas aggregans]GCD78702.1 tRNA N6-adenosine threonylcarbamoyltransferase [Thermaurantimonas aggregans]